MSERPFVPEWQRRQGRGRRQAPPEAKARATAAGGKSPYRLGRDFERAIRGRLERRGYYVMRAAMSKGKIDLLAVGAPCVEERISGLFVQCKRRGQIGSAEWNELWGIAETFGGWPILAMKLSENTVGFHRLDGPREPRRPGRPWTLIEPRDLSELVPPPSLL